MTGKKIPLDGGNQQTANQNIFHSYYNKIPTKKEIIDSYYSANQFFREASSRKNKEARWYFNQAREMEYKASLALEWRDHFENQASEYLELMIMARGASNV